MDGIHDMGGMHGFGRIPIEDDYVFDSDWQRRSFALAEALAPITPFGTDEHRQAIERIPPSDYLKLDYFEKWAVATESLLKQAGHISQDELDVGAKLFHADVGDRSPVTGPELVQAMKQGVPLKFPDDSQPQRFSEGDVVLVSSESPYLHTRLPRYVRGKTGLVASAEGVFAFPDAAVGGVGAPRQHCYTVAFSSETLWGREAEPNEVIHLDLWESYLEPA